MYNDQAGDMVNFANAFAHAKGMFSAQGADVVRIHV